MTAEAAPTYMLRFEGDMAGENQVDAAIERVLAAVRDERLALGSDAAMDLYRELIAELRQEALALRSSAG